MKAKLIIALCLLGITQSFAQSKVSPGIRAGWTMSTVSNMGGDYRTNYYIGLQLPIDLTRFYTLQPEINYSRQGVNNIQIRDFNSMRSRTTNLTVDYIDLNVINKFDLGTVILQAGPGLAFLTNGSEPNLTPVDLTFNLGVEIPLFNWFSVEARWRPGITDIDEDGFLWGSDYGVHYNNAGRMRNNVFQIGATFTF